MDDAVLVHRAGAGEREAWAEIYDRYSDRLHDYCWSILRDHHEAEDALHDAFVVAADRLSQLRDPSRLRPWLYSICRSQALAKARRRSKMVPTDGAADQVAAVTPPASGASPEQTAEQAGLAELVADAAGGLAARDRAVLDLHLRHGFDGAELGEALGVDAHHATVVLSRVRNLVERSLSALLVARTGRRECAELDRLLAGWDGRLSPLLRKRVARHIDGCDNCAERRRRMVSPIALLSAAPPVLAPAALRDRVLDDVVKVSASRPSGRSGDPGRRRVAVGAAAAAVVVALGIALLAAGGGHSGNTTTTAVAAGAGHGDELGTTAAPAAVGADAALPTVPGTIAAPAPADADPTSTTSAAATGAATTVVTTTAPKTTVQTTTPHTTATPGDPVVVLATQGIDLGVRSTAAELHFTNGGGQELAWTVGSGDALITVSPASGNLAPGAEAVVTVLFDRAMAAEGPFATELVVGGRGLSNGAAAATRTVPVKAVVERPPVVSDVGTDRRRIVFGSRTCGTSRATARVSDESALTVELTWGQDSGTARNVPMELVGPDRYEATIGPVPTPSGGDVTWYVSATDSRGNVTRTAGRRLPLATAC